MITCTPSDPCSSKVSGHFLELAGIGDKVMRYLFNRAKIKVGTPIFREIRIRRILESIKMMVKIDSFPSRALVPY